MPARVVSFVVEWDNVRYYEVQRAREMLRRVSVQLAECRQRGAFDAAEVLLVYDEREIPATVVEGAAAEVRRDSPAAGGFEVRVVPAPGLGYYRLKNLGAGRSTGDIIIFVDSDVEPEAGWLHHLIAAFDDPAVMVVMGNSYIDPGTLLGRTFALAWYFPLRTADGPLRPTRSLFANNLAFRRSVFERFPFPDGDELYIQQSMILARTLEQHAIVVHLQPTARVAHPPPRLFRSAWIQGHDTVVRAAAAPAGRHLREAYWRLRSALSEAYRRIRRDGHHVGLTRGEVPAALALATLYYLVRFTVELLTSVEVRLRPAKIDGTVAGRRS